MRWLLALVVMAAPAMAEVTSARFTGQTDRYPHNVLGAIRGWTTLELKLTAGKALRIELPESRVFEDIAPRLWDITGDGRAEAIVVESEASQGARLAAYGADGLIAASDFIGTRFRWLAPLGVGDVMGLGAPQIAWVETPHLGRTLRLGRVQGRRIVVTHSLPGVTAHRIGDETITGGMRPCAPEIVAISPDWRNILHITRSPDGQGLSVVSRQPHSAAALRAALDCP